MLRLARRTTSIILLAMVLWIVPSVAFAYNEGGSVDPAVTDCIDCHAGDYSSGPHGGYIATSRKCVTCHAVHEAPASSVNLLPGPTVTATCAACHDGTAGSGVYGALAAAGLSPVSRHRIDVTDVVPGGDSSTGGTSTATFLGENGYMSCDDCHSPHGAATVASFTGDRARNDTDTAFVSDRLLRQRPTSAVATVTVYGSDWCGACHKGRISASAIVHNHPTDSTVSTSSPFYYEQVARVTTETAITTELGTLGRTNRGYVMPSPRSAEQTGHAPICQQCHEDVRSVGTSGAVTQFTVTQADGAQATDNPRFQVFPHESDNPSLLLEVNEDLCTNCHDSGSSMP